jgi:hypothetical protein
MKRSQRRIPDARAVVGVEENDLAAVVAVAAMTTRAMHANHANHAGSGTFRESNILYSSIMHSET